MYRFNSVKRLNFSVNTLALTKPDKAAKVEAMLVQMARSGQIQEKVSSPNIQPLET